MHGMRQPNPNGVNWLVDIQREASLVDAGREAEAWGHRCIYRVPSCVKELHPKAYMPQVVSLGPYHHGEEHLRPMEEHKQRSLLHLLHRCGNPLEDFVAAVRGVLPQLMDAYQQLDDEWRDDPERFLRLMVVDGCFMLELMHFKIDANKNGYADNDPIFGRSSGLFVYIFRDMQLLENQLPLLLVQRLKAVQSGDTEAGEEVRPVRERCVTLEGVFTVLRESSTGCSASAAIETKEQGGIRLQSGQFFNQRVCHFFYDSDVVPPPTQALLLHPLDVCRWIFLSMRAPGWTPSSRRDDADVEIPYRTLSATELTETGIHIKGVRNPVANWFKDGVLTLPTFWVDIGTESELLNLMAFERLHVGARYEVISYIFFMARIAKSSKDVALLRSRGIICGAAGNDKFIAGMLDRVCAGVALEPDGPLRVVLRQMQKYSNHPWRRWRANIVRTYFSIPGTGYSLAGVVVALGLTVAQVVYSALQYHQAAVSQSK